jgi:BirA family biotin operon repressor/biotin-[acetyl-CoA-carboxylase] ligase
MATPYFQFRHEEVTSTQDLARAGLGRLPIVVIARRQTGGRGRSGAEWVTAPQALAVSAAYREEGADRRPISLLAGIAAVRTVDGVVLKWPNDVMVDEVKVGGILVERAGPEVVVGLGLNLWWPDPPPPTGSLFGDDPGPEAHARIGALWAAELLALIDAEDWPADEYRASCATLGREVEWEPEGRGLAVGIAEDGGLIVEDDDGTRVLNAGAIRHLRG